MKIIDLLNKIANGEEVPKKIKYKDDIYIHVDNYCYVCEETNETLSQNIYAEFSRLNDEVEIIEEDKKIKHLSYEETSLWVDDEDGKKSVETIVSINSKELVNKINEIIDYLNKEA